MSIRISLEDSAVEFDQLALERAVRALCRVGVRSSPLSLERVKAWINQFDSETEKTLAWLILRHLVYRTAYQLGSSMRQALKQATLHFLGTAGLMQQLWRDALAGKVDGLSFYCGPPASALHGKPGKSGEIVTRWVSRNYQVDKWYASDITELGPNERYLVIDDGTYTGVQLIEFLENWRDDYSDGKVSIVVGLAHERAIQTVTARFPQVRVFCGELLTEKNSLRWLSSRWMADGQWPYPGTPLDAYLDLCKRKGPFERGGPEGFGSLGLLVAFDHGIPDDSLQLLWDQSKHWTPLIER
jgi:hypothetical protein